LLVAPSKDLFCFGIKIWEEFFSYVLMEAVASGLPIVATRVNPK
jgi:glycosyltransferase involved in cell wall biosynthesis